MEISQYAPVMIPTLNRYEHFIRCVDSLSRCTHADKTDLYIALDYPAKEEHWEGYKKIKEFLKTLEGFKKIEVIKREKNFGALENINQTREYVFSKYDRIILSEDDNEFSPNFLDYINKGLDKFEDDPNVLAVCGYNYPVKMPRYCKSDDYYFSKKFAAWGYGVWKHKEIKYIVSSEDMKAVVKNFRLVKKLVKNHGLSILLNYFGYIKRKEKKVGDGAVTLQLTKKNQFTVFPVISKVRNHGHDGSGIHCGTIDNNPYATQTIDKSTYFEFNNKPISIDDKILKTLKSFTMISFKGMIKLFFYIIDFSFREYFVKIVKNPKLTLFKTLYKSDKYFNHYMPDSIYLKIVYYLIFRKDLNLKNPQTFNEKLQWLKLYDRNPLYTKLVDKYEVRKYIEEKIGSEYLIPLIGVWDKFEDIDFDKLPNQFVLKPTHDSGSVIICKDKTRFDIEQAKLKINKSLKKNHYYGGREYCYKNIKPRIIAEKFMFDESGTELKDYKFMCFSGKVKCSFVCLNRNNYSGLNVDFYSYNWEKMPFERHYPDSKTFTPKPYNYEKMIKFAELLAKNIPFVRVDFYEVNQKLFFGELTFYPGSGFEKFTPEFFDYKLGSCIKLPKEKVK